MIISPAFFGPNALPVPELDMAEVSNEMRFTIRGDIHFGQGDRTQNVFGRLYVPLAKDFASIEMFWVPWEHYKLSPETRDERRARMTDAEGNAAGDVYFGSTIKIMREHPNKKRPSITLGLFTKTTSGTHLFNARFTDTPGYYFTVNMGKTFNISAEKDKTLRIYGSQGFYVWQTFSGVFVQNDAYSFGAGIQLKLNKFSIKQDFAGYIGYIDDGDKPMVYRSMIAHRNKLVEHELRYQAGLQDFPYHSISYGISFIFAPGYLQ